MFEGADVAPVDLVRLAVEVVVAEACQAGAHRVDFRFLAEEGGKRCLVVALHLCGAELMAGCGDRVQTGGHRGRSLVSCIASSK